MRCPLVVADATRPIEHGSVDAGRTATNDRSRGRLECEKSPGHGPEHGYPANLSERHQSTARPTGSERMLESIVLSTPPYRCAPKLPHHWRHPDDTAKTHPRTRHATQRFLARCPRVAHPGRGAAHRDHPDAGSRASWLVRLRQQQPADALWHDRGRPVRQPARHGHARPDRGRGGPRGRRGP